MWTFLSLFAFSAVARALFHERARNTSFVFAINISAVARALFHESTRVTSDLFILTLKLLRSERALVYERTRNS